MNKKSVLFFKLLVLVSIGKLSAQSVTSIQKKVVIDNFESYTNDEQLAKAWYDPPHGASSIQTIEHHDAMQGNQALRVEYHIDAVGDHYYSPICRVNKWNLTGCNAIQFWYKPDGSGRSVFVELNIANSKGYNIHDLWDFKFTTQKGDTAPALITIPFNELKHNIKYADAPDVSNVFKPEAVIEVAICLGGKDEVPADGVFLFDDFNGVFVDAVKNSLK